jgi:hypothetical protein
MTHEVLRLLRRRALSPELEEKRMRRWVHTYVTSDRLYCVYLAESEQVVRDHAKRAGLPATEVMEVKRVIDPLTATRSRA